VCGQAQVADDGAIGGDRNVFLEEVSSGAGASPDQISSDVRIAQVHDRDGGAEFVGQGFRP